MEGNKNVIFNESVFNESDYKWIHIYVYECNNILYITRDSDKGLVVPDNQVDKLKKLINDYDIENHTYNLIRSPLLPEEITDHHLNKTLDIQDEIKKIADYINNFYHASVLLNNNNDLMSCVLSF